MGHVVNAAGEEVYLRNSKECAYHCASLTDRRTVSISGSVPGRLTRHAVRTLWRSIVRAACDSTYRHLDCIFGKTAVADVFSVIARYLNACQAVRIATQVIQNSLPGFRIPCGSSACLIARIAAISAGEREIGRNSRFNKPMPCSADTDPFNGLSMSYTNAYTA